MTLEELKNDISPHDWAVIEAIKDPEIVGDYVVGRPGKHFFWMWKSDKNRLRCLGVQLLPVASLSNQQPKPSKHSKSTWCVVVSISPLSPMLRHTCDQELDMGLVGILELYAKKKLEDSPEEITDDLKLEIMRNLAHVDSSELLWTLLRSHAPQEFLELMAD